MQQITNLVKISLSQIWFHACCITYREGIRACDLYCAWLTPIEFIHSLDSRESDFITTLEFMSSVIHNSDKTRVILRTIENQSVQQLKKKKKKERMKVKSKEIMHTCVMEAIARVTGSSPVVSVTINPEPQSTKI